MVYAEVAVDAPAPEKTYTYLVPPTLRVSRGQTVWVPLGRESRLTQGFVFAFSQDPPPVPDVKAIHAVIEAQPMLSQVALDLAWWLSDYYFAPLFECAALMMPSGFRQRIKTSIQLLSDPARGASALPIRQAGAPERMERLLALLSSRRAPVDLRELRRALGAGIDRQVDALVRDGHAIRVSQFQRPTTGPKYQRKV
ncbi:MAG TPA: hypothetical protein VJM51_09245, partial [Dehalococcoidia bacterium]|nr:hypothetical protein [Dehalococcoidia bacterium]